MEKSSKNTLLTCGGLAVISLVATVLTAFVIMAVTRHLKNKVSGLFTTARSEVYMTPSQIESIRDIGQWEFVAINDEEIVDTLRRGFFTDDHLVRIYYGTLRLGLDLSTLSADCVSVTADGTTVVRLPAVVLLDDNFIDEARTKSFHESGRWSARDRIDLYERARQKMMARALTAENISYTQMLAEQEVRRLLKSMGIEPVVITFE